MKRIDESYQNSPRPPAVLGRMGEGQGVRASKSNGFTLVELLVVITIITMLAALALGALAKAREVARRDATMATIAKIDGLVARRWETYRTRRIPIDLSGGNQKSPAAYAALRLKVLRSLMRAEMPDSWDDVTTAPGNGVALPALQRVYQAKHKANPPNAADHQQAKCLYMWVMTSIPDAATMFTSAEVDDVDGDGWKCFIDGWGKPIGFLRWAPGATAWSDIQKDDADHHDPLDPLLTEKSAYHLYPLIFAGVLGKTGTAPNLVDDYGIKLTSSGADPYAGGLTGAGSISANGGPPLVHNHHMEQK